MVKPATIDPVAHIVEAVQALGLPAPRHLIAVAGPPAAGKSTLAARLCAGLEAAGLPSGLVPMDGFHLDNDTLEARGLLGRKGAPETFDLDGFAALLARLGREEAISVPLFDRDADAVIPEARVITPAQRHIVVEGNYLFLDEPGWRQLAPLWSYRVFLSCAMQELTRRLIQRWTDQGLPAKQAEARARENDLVNAQRVLQGSDLAEAEQIFS